MAKYWYSYSGPNTSGDRILTNNWNYVGTAYPPNPCAANFSTPCLIYATGAATPATTGTHPSKITGTSPGQISSNLQGYLSSTIGVSKRYPLSGGKSFVYNRS